MKINRCIKCGGIAVCSIYPDGLFGVECTNYYCDSEYIIMGDTRDEAIEAWNEENKEEEP